MMLIAALLLGSGALACAVFMAGHKFGYGDGFDRGVDVGYCDGVRDGHDDGLLQGSLRADALDEEVLDDTYACGFEDGFAAGMDQVAVDITIVDDEAA